MKYRSEIDGLRAVAVVPVIFFHADFPIFSGGFVGVDVFFVISGYLITTIILSELEKGTFSLVNFYERRARRILPALFLVMLVSLPFAWVWLLPSDMKDLSQSLVAVSLFSSNVLFWNESGYWDTASELKPLLHTWSLAVEEQYYLLFPLFLMLMWNYRKRWIFGTFVVIAGVSLCAAQWGAYHQPSATFYLLPTRGWELAIGAGIAFYFLYPQPIIGTLHSQKWINEVFGLLGLSMIAYAIFVFDETTPFPGFFALVPTVGTGLVILFSSNQTLSGRLLSFKPMVAIGIISYSAYLWHQPVFAFARHRLIAEPNQLIYIALALLSFLLAYISWRYVEKPFRVKGIYDRRAIFTFSVVTSIVFVSVGLIGHVTNGFQNRANSDVIELASPNIGRLDVCAEDIKRISGATCLIGSPEVPPTIVLIGDSHSTRLTKSLDEILRTNNKAMLIFAQSWCAPLIDFGTDNPNKRPFCRDYMNEAFKFVKNDSTLKTVILAAEWANYTTGRRSGDKSTSYYNDSLSKEKSRHENELAFARSLKRTGDLLSAAGKSTVLITSVPEYELDLPKALAKFRFLGVRELDEKYRIDLPKYSERNKEVAAAFDIASITSWAIIVDSYSALCGKKYCRYTDGNRALYQDGNHLSYEGSRAITRRLEKYVRQ